MQVPVKTDVAELLERLVTEELPSRNARDAWTSLLRSHATLVRRLETDLSEKLGATVAIEHGPKGGRVVIRYNGLDELEGILAHIR